MKRTHRINPEVEEVFDHIRDPFEEFLDNQEYDDCSGVDHDLFNRSGVDHELFGYSLGGLDSLNIGD